MGEDLNKASKKGTDAHKVLPLSWPPPMAKGFPRFRPHPIHPAKAWPGERTQPKKVLDFIEAGTPGDGAPRPTEVDVHRDLAARTAEVADHQLPRPSPVERPRRPHRPRPPPRHPPTAHIPSKHEEQPTPPPPGRPHREHPSRATRQGRAGQIRRIRRSLAHQPPERSRPRSRASRPDLAVGPSQETPTPDLERG